MADPKVEPWYPTAAYLYILHLDDLSLAWEYLRRHPDYRRDWRRRRDGPEAAHRWGLRLLEDPRLDARDAHPAWFPDHGTVAQLYPDADPPPGAAAFAFWRIPGAHLIHDGRRLLLRARWAGGCLRAALAPGLADGAPYVAGFRFTGAVVVAGRDSLQDSVSQVGQETTRRNLNVQPTLTGRPGLPVRIIVSRDLVLRPYQAMFFNRGTAR